MRSFLVDIDPNIELPEYNLVLYSLYEEPITELYNITNFNIKPFFIGIDEISFNIPMTRNETDGQIVRNEIYDMVDGEYYIKLNDSKFFVINKINEKANDDGSTHKEVSAYSREAELNQKRLVDYKASSRMLYDRENTMLEDENGQLIERGILNYIFDHITKAWTVGTVDEKVVSLTNQGISRELNFSNSSLIQVFQELQKTYNCIFEFNTITQVVDVESAINYDLNVEDIANSPQYKGLYISDENFIKNMSKNIEYDKIKTRLFLYGKDNISIQNIHPTGQPYIDNLSAFKTTKFMTQELIDGLNAYDLLIENADPNFTPLLNQLQTKNAELEELYNKDDSVLENKGLVALRRELGLIQTNIDTRVANLAMIRETILGAEGTDLSGLYTQMKTIQTEVDGFENQKTNISELIETKNTQITDKENEIKSVKNQIQGIRDSLSIQANLAPHLVKELDKFIRVEIYNDSNFTENNIMELYEEGKKNLTKISQPSIQFDVDVVDFLSIVECQHTWDKFVLGDIVLLENKNIGFSYYVRLVGYEHSPDNNSLNLKFSNTNSFDDATLWIKDLLEQMSNTTSTLDFNKYKWDKAEDMQDRISKMVDEKLEEARQNILSAVGQRHLFDDSGLWLYKENPDGTLDDAQIRAINSDIVLTDDNFATIKTAISARDGINAEVIRGKLGQFAIVTADQIEVGGGENPPNLNDELTRIQQETQDNINLVNGEISDVDGKINGLESFTNIAFKDGIMDMAEKESLSVHIQQLNNEKADVDAKYTSIYADVDLTGTPKSVLSTAKSNYNTAHSNLLTVISDTVDDDKIEIEERALVDNAFIDYRVKLSALSIAFENAIRSIESEVSLRTTLENALIPSEDYNGVLINKEVGLLVTRGDNKVKSFFNATEGIKIQKNKGTKVSPNWVNTFHTDTDGNIAMGEGTTISWAGVTSKPDINTQALQAWKDSGYATNITSNGIYTGTVTANKILIGGNNGLLSFGDLSDKPWIPQNAEDVGALPSDWVPTWSEITSKPTILSANDIKSTIITKDWIGTLGLMVGDQIQMGNNATISWEKVTGVKPSQYTNPQALKAWTDSGYATNITATGLYTGTVTANKILIGGVNGSISFGDLSDKPWIPQNAEDVGALPSDWVPTWSEIKSKPTILSANDIKSTVITKDWIGTLGLMVGSEIQMGTNAKISWANVTNQPSIPSQYTNPQALKAWTDSGYATNITATGLYTGTVTANKILIGGANGSISFDDLANKPSIPTKASDIGALPTGTFIPVVPNYITSTKITSTTIESPTISSGIIIGSEIKTAPSGKRITLNEFNSNDLRIYDNGGNQSFIVDYDTNGNYPSEATNRVFLRSTNSHALKIESQNANMSIEATGGKKVHFNGNVDFTQATVSGLTLRFE